MDAVDRECNKKTIGGHMSCPYADDADELADKLTDLWTDDIGNAVQGHEFATVGDWAKHAANALLEPDCDECRQWRTGENR